MGNFTAFEPKMTAAGMGDAAIRAFRRNYEALLRNETGMIPEASISPAVSLPRSKAIATSAPADAALLSQAVVIKLNGGLGTSMGLQGPKSLLAVRDGVNFLDLMVRQILDLRKTSGAPVRLLLMNSFSTSEDTLGHLERYRAEGLADASEVELMQNQIPKIDAATLRAGVVARRSGSRMVPARPRRSLPGARRQRLARPPARRRREIRLRFQFRQPRCDPRSRHPAPTSRIPAHPSSWKCTRRTAADRKGGHLAMRKSDGRLLLREVAQCPDADLDAFQDIDRHQYFNTNSLWLRLDLLKEQLAADSGVLPLPMIRNNKTVDPRDKKSTAVIQLEIAMGAAIECFEGSAAIDVPRSRFAPVKTTGDLLALRSDAYEVLENGQVRLAASRQGMPPVISLSDEYKLVDSIEDLGVPEPDRLSVAENQRAGPFRSRCRSSRAMWKSKITAPKPGQ